MFEEPPKWRPNFTRAAFQVQVQLELSSSPESDAIGDLLIVSDDQLETIGDLLIVSNDQPKELNMTDGDRSVPSSPVEHRYLTSLAVGGASCCLWTFCCRGNI